MSEHILQQIWTTFLNPQFSNNPYFDKTFTKNKFNIIDEAHQQLENGSDDAISLWFDTCNALLDLTRKTFLNNIDSFSGFSFDDKQKIFLRKQVSACLQAKNFLCSNREALTKAIKTDGESLKSGMNFFLDDLISGKIILSPPSAYETGSSIACTPGSVVFKNELIELIQYQAKTKSVRRDPLLIVPPFINKYYILDLQPHNSLIKYLVEKGLTVFVISWANPTSHGHTATWIDYTEDGVIEAIRVVRDICKGVPINLAGYCIGGTLATSALSLMNKRNKKSVKSLTLLNSLIDYSDGGELSLFINEEMIQDLEVKIGKNGIFPGTVISNTFSLLKPHNLIWDHVSNAYLEGEEPRPFDFLHWNNDVTNVSGPLLTWCLKELYLNNSLMNGTAVTPDGRNIDPTSIECAKFIVVSEKDHIVPWEGAYRSVHLWDSETHFLKTAGGHVAGVVNPPNHPGSYYYFGVTNKDTTVKRWIDDSKHEKGSWWPQWASWLARRSGPLVRSRKEVGNKRYSSSLKAPGIYVKT